MSKAIAVLNEGSSSLKFALFRCEKTEPALVVRGQIEGIGGAPRLKAKDANGAKLADEGVALAGDNAHLAAFKHVAAWIEKRVPQLQIAAVGHRVVHGGMDFTAPVLVDDEVLQRLEALVPLAPLHQPHNLTAIRAVRAASPELPQVACFDTAFHRGRSSVVERYALPDRFYRSGILRYGFHGLSYEYIARSLRHIAPEIAGGRVIVAHLGSGASLCAIKDGRSVDTTMGFSVLDGLPMGTRCGSLDPGVLLYLLRHGGMSPDQIERLLYDESGLLGISGVSNDMRDLLASPETMAREAVEYFVLRTNRELGALVAILGGLDALVFTAGIGEGSAEIRARVCRAAGWLGIELDESANLAGGPCISRSKASPSVWVIPTDEERMIALHVLAILECAESARG